MKLTFLGQAGWLISAGDTQIMVDPYLSDSLLEKNGEAYCRNVPVRPEFLEEQLDAVVITHDHGDHLDMQTLRKLFAAQQKPLTVLGPRSVWERLRKENPWKHNNLVLFEKGTEYTVKEVLLKAVFAAHSDPCAIGLVLEGEEKRVYHSGDTLFHRELISADTREADVLLLSINGKGNNMDAADAARLTRLLNPRLAVPMHYDMFSAMGCDPKSYINALEGEKACLLRAYEEIRL